MAVIVSMRAFQRNPHKGRPKRRRNPAGWWAFGALALTTAAGITGYVLWNKRRKRNYVGSGWDWPQRNLFPTEQSFGEALAKLGYGAAYGLPGWEILSVETMATVAAFQRDFNEVRRAFQLQAIVPELDADGLIGEGTIGALKFALDQNYRPDDSWIALVHDARMKNTTG